MATPEEQAKLALYTGWGWAQEVFRSRYIDSRWTKDFNELESLLTEEEFDAVRDSIVNAHYTSKEVVESIYGVLRGTGFYGGRVLEPGCGVGNFIGLMPPDMWARSQITGVEKETIAGSIAKHLYQSADIQVTPMQNSVLADNFYDLAIGNVPFGNFGVADIEFERTGRQYLERSIHNYFFAKALDKVRPGGLLCMITSTYAMDSSTGKMWREYMAKHADLLMALRLPGETFAKNAGTKVTSDILFLRKRMPGETGTGEKWADVVETPIDIELANGEKHTVTVELNEYFKNHRDHVLGKMLNYNPLIPNGRGTSVTSDGRNIQKAIAQAGWKLLGIYKASETPNNKPDADRMIAPEGLNQGGFIVQGGKVYVREGRDLVPRNVSPTDVRKYERMTALRDHTRALIASMGRHDSTDAEIASMQSELTNLYASFYNNHGYLHDPKNVRAFGDDPDYPLLLALETKSGNRWVKSDIFTKRTIVPASKATHADNARDAMMISLRENGNIDLDHMAKLTGKSQEEVQSELVRTGVAFLNPGGSLETADSYLSGDVRKKLAEARAAAKLDPKYKPNVDALEAVQPVDLAPGEIDANFGAPWIPNDVIVEFMNQIIGYSRDHTAEFNEVEGEWRLDTGPLTRTWSPARRQFETEEVDILKMLRMTINGKHIVVYRTEGYGDTAHRVVDAVATELAQQRQEALRNEFRKWVWSDPDRAESLAKRYNVMFNNLRQRQYDGSHLELPGLSAEWAAPGKMHKHVKDAIWRQLQSGTTLLAHAVGAGKTAEMIGAAMEMRRLGIARKPMFVVPNSLVGQWAEEIRSMYPGAKVLMTTPQDFTPSRRRALAAKIATGDWDAVLVAHSHFTKLPLSADAQEEYIKEQIEHIENAIASKDRTETVKKLVKAKLRLEVKLQKLRMSQDENTIPFESLGVDQLFVDEFHLFKNLGIATKRQSVAGLPTGNGSARALDMYMKTQHLIRRNNGRGVVAATGTPIANSIAEMYTMMRYLSNDRLRMAGLGHFDSWANNYGEVVSSVELKPNGKYGVRLRFSKFTNVPELAAMYQQFADVKTQEDLNLKLPKAKRIPVICPPSPSQVAYIKQLQYRAEAILGEHGERPPLNEDNMLKLMSDWRKCSLDIRLVDPHAPENPDSKVNRCVSNVANVYKRTKDKLGTQILFLDLGTPKTKDNARASRVDIEAPDEDDLTAEERSLQTSVYEDLRKKLIAQGIPAHEIAFIHDAKTQKAKVDLFDDVNQGKIRVLIGSTEKMGVGMNAQKKVVALHHIDCPWRPCDLEQREGRAIRQGNENDEVELYLYATGGEGNAMSADTLMYQYVETKGKAINQIQQGKTDGRTMDDVGLVITAGEMKGLSSANPLVREKVAVDNDLHKYERLAQAHIIEQQKISYRAHAIPKENEELAKKLKVIADDEKHYMANKSDHFSMVIDGKTYTNPEEAGNIINKKMIEAHFAPGVSNIGSLDGFTIQIRGGESPELSLTRDPTAASKGLAATYYCGVGDGGRSTAAKMTYALSSIPGRIKHIQETIENNKKEAESLMNAMRPFEHQEKLEELRRRAEEINEQLGVTKKDNSAFSEDDDEGDDSVDYEGLEKALLRTVIISGSNKQTVDRTMDAIEKAIALNRQTGSMQGKASYMTPMRSLANAAQSVYSGARRAIQTVRSPRMASVAAAARMRGVGGNQYEAADSEHAARVVSKLGAKRGMSVGEPHRMISAGSRGQAAVAHTVDVNGRQVQITQKPKASLQNMQRPPKATPKTPKTPSMPKQAVPQTEKVMPPVNVHDRAVNLGMHHVATNTKAKRNWYGKRIGDIAYHDYHHPRPHVAARLLRSGLQETHKVSNIRRRKVYMKNGTARVVAAFHATPKNGGSSHIISVMRKSVVDPAMCRPIVITGVEGLIFKALDDHDVRLLSLFTQQEGLLSKAAGGNGQMAFDFGGESENHSKKKPEVGGGKRNVVRKPDAKTPSVGVLPGLGDDHPNEPTPKSPTVAAPAKPPATSPHVDAKPTVTAKPADDTDYSEHKSRYENAMSKYKEAEEWHAKTHQAYRKGDVSHRGMVNAVERLEDAHHALLDANHRLPRHLRKVPPEPSYSLPIPREHVDQYRKARANYNKASAEHDELSAKHSRGEVGRHEVESARRRKFDAGLAAMDADRKLTSALERFRSQGVY
jgi:N12 class adenine-specific DNA methylase